MKQVGLLILRGSHPLKNFEMETALIEENFNGRVEDKLDGIEVEDWVDLVLIDLLSFDHPPIQELIAVRDGLDRRLQLGALLPYPGSDDIPSDWHQLMAPVTPFRTRSMFEDARARLYRKSYKNPQT